MTTNIIIQIVIAIIFAGGVAGLVKLPNKQKLIAGFVTLISIVATILLWSIK